MDLSASQGDYLKLIWYLENENKKATVKAISDLYAVRPPTVLSMLQQLSRMQLVTYNKKDGAELTATGDQMARKLVRKHRLIETFLEQILQLDEQFIHEEAERLEHVVSDQLIHCIDERLGFPKVDPHGAAIPYSDEVSVRHLLSALIVGQSFKVASIKSATKYDAYLSDREFRVNSVWILNDIIPDGSGLMLSNGHRMLIITKKIADEIFVTIQE